MYLYVSILITSYANYVYVYIKNYIESEAYMSERIAWKRRRRRRNWSGR